MRILATTILSRILLSGAVAASLLLVGCRSGTQTTVEPDFEEPQLTPKLADLADRTLRLVVECSGGKRNDRLAIESWFMEGLAQSSWLDIASAEDALGEGVDAIVLRGTLEPGALSILTTTLEPASGVPTPLAGVREVRWPELAGALDRLAVETRRTLGEPIESIRRDARPSITLVSADLRVAAACTRARQMLGRRRLPLADSTLRQALGRDPSCALALSLAAGTRLDLGRSQTAVEFARRALSLENRLSPSAAQRAARVVLLADGRAAERLLELADATLRERPYDAQARFTRGLAFALAARYDEALPVLEGLRARLPASPGLLFALGHARLATGDLDGTRELLPDVDARVPELPAARLRAFLLFAADDHTALRTLFDQLEKRPGFRSGHARLTLVVMRAAEAILAERDAEAAAFLLEYLDRLRSLPEVLRAQPSTLVDTAWTLVRLDKAVEAQRAIAALRGPKGFEESLRASDALASGMLSLARDGSLATDRIRNVEELGDRSGARRLEGLAFKARGRIERALLSLRAAVPGSRDPALVLEIAECEALAGRLEKAKTLRADLVRELQIPRLDAPGEHPLLRPSHALALRSAR